MPGRSSGDAGDLELGGTSGDRRLWGITSSNSTKYFTEARCSSPSAAGVCVGLTSIP